MNLAKHIEKRIHKLGLENSKFLLAVSGGEDSMVLLDAFEKTGFPIMVAHVNYQLRGEDSDLDQVLVENYCKAKSIKCVAKRFEITEPTGIQERARKLRYEWFRELLTENELDVIVTAHHKNDQAETLVFNLLRGAGLDGMTGMEELNGEVFRPLLAFEKKELSAFRIENNVPFRLDKSNLSTKYSRNKLRNQVFELFEEINPQFIHHISESVGLLSHAKGALDYVVNDIWDSNSVSTAEGFRLQLDSWIGLEFSSSILFAICKRLGFTASESKSCIKLLDSSTGKAMHFDAFKVWRNRGEIIFQKSEYASESEFYLEIPVIGNYDLPEGNISLCTEKNLGDFKVEKNELICAVENLKWPLVIRSWRAGDKFHPFGMKGTQKVSDLLIQNKVSSSDKQNVLVLESDGEVLWVLGYRTSELTRVNESSDYYLKAIINV